MPDAKEMEKTGIDMVAEHSHSLTFDEKVIRKIAGLSVNEVPGILAMSGNFITGLTDMLRSSEDPTKGITVEVGKKQVSVGMRVICEYGRNMPVIFQDIVDKVTQSVKEMTGLDVVEVKVHVYDVLTKEDFEKQSRKKADEKVEKGMEKEPEKEPEEDLEGSAE